MVVLALRVQVVEATVQVMDPAPGDLGVNSMEVVVALMVAGIVAEQETKGGPLRGDSLFVI